MYNDLMLILRTILTGLEVFISHFIKKSFLIFVKKICTETLFYQ